ncbi:acyl-CoA dehydrogenase domain-containing protein, partial [Escherichia sp. R-CC3]
TVAGIKGMIATGEGTTEWNSVMAAMDDLLQNFPNRVVAGLLNVVIFPTGRHYLAPSDKLDHKVAKILQVPNATRSR